MEDLIKLSADIKITENYVKQMKTWEEDKIRNNEGIKLGNYIWITNNENKIPIGSKKTIIRRVYKDHGYRVTLATEKGIIETALFKRNLII